MTIELNIWNKETKEYEISQVLEKEFIILDLDGKYEVRTIYTHPFTPEVRIFADPKE